jgi:hypothetical protein
VPSSTASETGDGGATDLAEGSRRMDSHSRGAAIARLRPRMAGKGILGGKTAARLRRRRGPGTLPGLSLSLAFPTAEDRLSRRCGVTFARSVSNSGWKSARLWRRLAGGDDTDEPSQPCAPARGCRRDLARGLDRPRGVGERKLDDMGRGDGCRLSSGGSRGGSGRPEVIHDAARSSSSSRWASVKHQPKPPSSISRNSRQGSGEAP